MFKSISEITDKLLELEEKNKLFELEIEGVFVWELIRYKIYNKCLSFCFEGNSISKRRNLISKILYSIGRYFNATVQSPFFDRHKTEILIFESSRKLKYNSEYIDPYTKFISDKLVAEGKNVSYYRSSYSFDKLAVNNQKVKHLDLLYLVSSFRSWFATNKITPGQSEYLCKIKSEVKENLKVEIDIERMVLKEIKIFKSNIRLFLSILKNKQPKQIFLVNFCDKQAIIAAAKIQGVLTSDIQHGIISSGDIIYHYPNIKEGSLHYFPDRFLTWSMEWIKNCKIPIKKENIYIEENTYLQRQKSKYKELKKLSNQIIILSQPGLTRGIFKNVLSNIKSFNEFNILYKLHPNEYETAYSYPEYTILKEYSNVHFVPQNEDLHQLLAESEIAIGVCSTALVEALEFNCRVMLFDLPGKEWMRAFIESGKMKTLKSFEKHELN